MEKVILLLCLGFISVFGQALNTTGCKACIDRQDEHKKNRLLFEEWKNRTNYVTRADQFCSEAEDIYNKCWMTCATDASGKSVPNVDQEKPMELQSYITDKCINHTCRRAELEGCSLTKGPRRNFHFQCSNAYKECRESLHDQKTCEPERLCHHGERANYIDEFSDRLKCSLSANSIKNEEIDFSDKQQAEAGLLLCEDILTVKCLAAWHKSAEAKDFKNFTTASDDFKALICSKDYKSQLAKCFYDAVNGTIDYTGADFRSPCNIQYMNSDSVVVMTSVITDAMQTVETMCNKDFVRNCQKSSTDSANSTIVSVKDNSTVNVNETESNNTTSSKDTVDKTDEKTVEKTTEKTSEGIRTKQGKTQDKSSASTLLLSTWLCFTMLVYTKLY